MNRTSAVTSKLGKIYREWKSVEKEKNQLRDEFFQLASGEMQDHHLATQMRNVFGPSEIEARARAQEQFPGWTVEEVTPTEADYFTVILQEDPEFKPFTFVNHEDGMVYSKQVTAGSMQLDDERMKSLDPELYENVTYVPDERKLKPLDQLSPEEFARVQEFIYEGKPKIRLAPPRKAKNEELAETLEYS